MDRQRKGLNYRGPSITHTIPKRMSILISASLVPVVGGSAIIYVWVPSVDRMFSRANQQTKIDCQKCDKGVPYVTLSLDKSLPVSTAAIDELRDHGVHVKLSTVSRARIPGNDWPHPPAPQPSVGGIPAPSARRKLCGTCVHPRECPQTNPTTRHDPPFPSDRSVAENDVCKCIHFWSHPSICVHHTRLGTRSSTGQYAMLGETAVCFTASLRTTIKCRKPTVARR